MVNTVKVSGAPRILNLLPAVAATVALLAVGPSSLKAQPTEKERRRLEACRDVLQESLAGTEGIPHDLLNKAHCVAVVPGTKKFALGWGGRFGKGAVVCRREAGQGWGAPLLITMGGGSWGAQVGFQDADYVLLVMNRKGIDHLLSSNFTLGGDVAVAAGPVGRSGSATTDVSMNAEILSYSRSKGLFAGVSLEGAMVKQDGDGNADLYGQRVDPKAVLLSNEFRVPPSAEPLVRLLDASSPAKRASR